MQLAGVTANRFLSTGLIAVVFILLFKFVAEKFGPLKPIADRV